VTFGPCLDLLDDDDSPVEIDRNGLEILSHQQCLRLLGTQVLGRIGITVDALPVVLPVNYRLCSDQIVIQTERGTRLAHATASRAVVAFEVDEIDADGLGWSVAFTGITSEINDRDLLSQLRSMPFTRWVRHADDRYVSISVDDASGRRITGMSREIARP
jgi:uncharacterized protein